MMYQELRFDEPQILALYEANQWTNYTLHKETLFEGIKQSLYCYGAYDKNTLVGLIRVVGDGHTIIYIQDILVHPLYHRQGIGTKLMNHVLQKYQTVRQIILTTDNTVEQKSFYESLDFVAYEELDLVGFFQKKERLL
jgi:ribosomal protein S18 acetylase RimI-like enzyme